MTPIEIVLVIFLVMALMAMAYTWAEMQNSRTRMIAAYDIMQKERETLKDEAAKLAAQTHEIGSNWKILSDRVGELTTKVSAVQANQNANSIGARTR